VVNQPSSPAKYMHGLDLLRILAALAVIYNHYSNWLRLNGLDFLPAHVVDGLLTDPLHLNERLSFVGVCVFLLISGMVVTHVAFRESPSQFLGRRAARLLPAMWVMVAIAWVMVSNKWLTANRPPDGDDLVYNLLLVNFAVPGTSWVLAITWTLCVQMAFYLFVAGTIPLLKRQPWLPPAIAVVLVSVLLSVTPPESGPPASSLRMITTFLPVLFIGQLISLVRSGRLPVPAGLALGVLQYLMFIRADLTSEQWPPGEAFPRQLLVLTLVLLIATKAEGRLVRSPWVAAMAKRTYAIYLVHIPVGFPVLGGLTPVTGYWGSIAVALVGVALAAELLHRLVELPAANWYRKREKARRERREARSEARQRA
jgi:exopolysaccharide production protein ExoZ